MFAGQWHLCVCARVSTTPSNIVTEIRLINAHKVGLHREGFRQSALPEFWLHPSVSQKYSEPSQKYPDLPRKMDFWSKSPSGKGTGEYKRKKIMNMSQNYLGVSQSVLFTSQVFGPL